MMTKAKYMKRKKIETSKLLLWICLFAESIMLIIIIYGWLHGLSDAPEMFTGVCALMAITILGYYIKAGFENVNKGKIGANLVPDLFTLLQGIFSALQCGDTSGAISSVINAIQMIIQNHPEFTNSDMPNISTFQNNNEPKG